MLCPLSAPLYEKKNTCIWFHKLDHILKISVCSMSANTQQFVCYGDCKCERKVSLKNAERESRWIMVTGVLLKAAPFSVGIQYLLKTYIFWVSLVIHDVIFWAACVMITSSWSIFTLLLRYIIPMSIFTALLINNLCTVCSRVHTFLKHFNTSI